LPDGDFLNLAAVAKTVEGHSDGGDAGTTEDVEQGGLVGGKQG
jgi:hypothetical protein